MSIIKHTYPFLMAACIPATFSQAANTDTTNASGQAQSLSKAESIASFKSSHQRSPLARRTDGSIARVYGQAFSTGPTAQISTQRFLDQNLNIWGVEANELIAEGPFEDGHHTQPIGYLPETDSYKFTGHYYRQSKAGLPVFRSKLVLLVRNKPNNPLVLASSQLHDLHGFTPNPQLLRSPVNQARIESVTSKAFDNVGAFIHSTRRVIFAGVDASPFPPTLADESILTINGFDEYLIITDAATGEIIFQENLIHTIDVTGNFSGRATDGLASDLCEPEPAFPLPYLGVGVQGGGSTFTDINGDFTIPNAGNDPVTVEATLSGQWFNIINAQGSTSSESATITPPNPANFLFNNANRDETVRAQVNAYVHANRVRDLVVSTNPAFPDIGKPLDIEVNHQGPPCPNNAWLSTFNGISLNFCLGAGSGSPNTAFASVLYHEYGHYLVLLGNSSGQGQFGEGFGDVMSVLMLDDPRLALGIDGNCNIPLRNAINNRQYPCSGNIHFCGDIYSGSVWDTRAQLLITEPENYIEILASLAIDSVLIHTGSEITPQLTIDWLTLDDDDGDITNGTPHYDEINAGFGAHNMPAPERILLDTTYPSGRPELINPDGSTQLLVDFSPIMESVDPSSPTMMVDSGSGFIAHPMTQLTDTLFQATFPPFVCGSPVDYYITSLTTSGIIQNSPPQAPASDTFTAIASIDSPVLAFDDNFETDQGWTVSGDAERGHWERAVPGVFYGSNEADYDGSGQCFVTDNLPLRNVTRGSTILTSPIMDATETSFISYARWFANDFGSFGIPDAGTFMAEVSDDAGVSWTNLETVGPHGPEVSGEWFAKRFPLNNIPGFTPNNQFKIRFIVSDNAQADGSTTIVDGAVDAVQLLDFDCTPPASCPADLTGDGDLNFFDVSAFLTAFSSGDLSADFTDDGVLNFFDVSSFLSAFSAGCP